MLLDCKRATALFIQNRELIAPSEVVPQLLKAGNKCDSRFYLYLYLHALFQVSPNTGKDFHDMQVCVVNSVHRMNVSFLFLYFMLIYIFLKYVNAVGRTICGIRYKDAASIPT